MTTILAIPSMMIVNYTYFGAEFVTECATFQPASTVKFSIILDSWSHEQYIS